MLRLTVWTPGLALGRPDRRKDALCPPVALRINADDVAHDDSKRVIGMAVDGRHQYTTSRKLESVATALFAVKIDTVTIRLLAIDATPFRFVVALGDTSPP